MHKRVFIPVAVLAVLLLGAGAVALAGSDEEAGKGVRAHPGRVVEEVLGELVADGTITQAQSDAILTAIKDRAAEIAEDLETMRERLGSFWDDGVLTRDEIGQLPFSDRILEAEGVADALEDDEITTEELDGLRSGSHLWRAGLRGLGSWQKFRSLWDDGVLTRDEIGQLPFSDRILEAEGVADALEDGEITTEEMDGLRSGLHPRGFDRGAGHRGFGGGGR